MLQRVLDLLLAEDCDLTRVVFCHICWAGFSLDVKKEIAARGCYLEFDTFGHIDMINLPNDGGYTNPPGDLERVKGFVELVQLGFARQLLLGQDIAWKSQLTAFGGPGYSHVLRNIVPLLRANGVSDDDLENILVHNPRRVLTLAQQR
jgi:phosphotriesterase-related protein